LAGEKLWQGKFPEIPGNPTHALQKKIHGNSRKFPEITGNFLPLVLGPENKFSCCELAPSLVFYAQPWGIFDVHNKNCQ
jgi:hypothetical protein